MPRETPPAKSLFLKAVESYTPEQWPQFLDEVCGGDLQLRQRVEDLLKAHQGKDSLLDPSPSPPAETIASPTRSSRSGTRVGPYRLLQEIGEGGMGVVYMAEQTHPVQRKVALKLIKPGLDNRQVIARFEAERQALALMDHPNIAHVLDAGTSDTGQPYFVMELVNGVPLTRYCDERRLPPRQRLELFVQVCQAVQHAHQKGIIHRDLKPSNVLVAQYDGKPVPKVIDFGVAKATGSKLTDKTMFTEFGSIVGTLEYMSPEQAERNQIDVDTRSDIYSLGVLLYELLTGTTPLDKKRLKSAAFLELLRIIQQEEPQKPSTRVSTADELPSIAANRSLEPRKLSGMIRGELDWIVMKALDKERSRRYETANGFAADVLRFLNDEPITACPPSTLYRFRKFARRNKALLTTVTIVAAALVVATAFSTWQASVATRARNQERIRAESESKARAEAEDARNRERTLRVEADAQRHRAEASEAKARAVVDEYLVKVTEDELLKVPGMQPLRRDLLRSGLRIYEEFLREREDDPRLTRELAATRLRVGRINSELGAEPEARAALDAAIASYESLLSEQPDAVDLKAELAEAWRAIGELYWEQNVVESLRGYQRAAEIGTQLVEAQPDNTAAKRALAKALNGLGVMQAKSQQGTAALASHQRCLELREELIQLDPDDATLQHAVGESLHNVATLLVSTHQRAALDLLQRSNRYNRMACERLPHVIEYGIDLGTNYAVMADAQWRLGEREEAVASYRKGVQHLQTMARSHPAVPAVHSHLVNALRSLAQMQSALGHATDAERSLQQASDSIERLPIETAADLYVLACVRGACVETLADPREQSQQELLAVETLQQAVDKGFRDVARLKQESAFARLREREPFQNLLSNLETKLEADSLVAGARDRTDASLQAHRRAAELRKKLADANPTNRRIQADFAASRQAVGLIQMELGRLDEAAQSLDEARHVREALVRDEPDNLQFRADLAASLFSQAKLDRQANRLTDVIRDWEAGLALFDTASLAESPTAEWQNQAANAELDYAQFLAGAGLYEEAAQHLARGYRRTPPSAALWRIHACLRQFVRDKAGNQDACRGLMEQFGMTSDNQLWQVAIACSLGSPPVGDVNRWFQVTDEFAKARPDQTWAMLYSGLALYRAERYQEAIRELQKDDRAASFPLVAMAYHRLGKHDEARYWLKRTRDWYEQTVRASLEGTLELTLGGLYVWDRPQFLVMYREAQALIEGVEAPDPWLDLWQARIYSVYGQNAKAQEHLQAAVAARPKDPALWLARAQVFARLGDHAQAEADFARAIDLSGDDPTPWIARGHHFAERGAQEKADADFAKAASLTPDNLDRFLAAGWWVAGPYPAGLETAEPPEQHLDPSQPPGPPAKADASAGDSTPPPAWQRVAPNALGTINLANRFPDATNQTCYLLTYVASPDERSVTLLLGGKAPRWVWLNGTLVHESTEETNTAAMVYSPRTSLNLRPGRNVLLVKTSLVQGSGWIDARLSDGIVERALAYSEQGRFAEALSLWNQISQQVNYLYADRLRALCAAAAGDDAAYRDAYDAMQRSAGNTREHYTAHSVLLACGLSDQPYSDPVQWDLMIQLVREKRMSAWRDGAALAEFRAGRHEQALKTLTEEDPENYPPHWPLVALVHHALGHGAEAKVWLQKAQAWRDSPAQDAYRRSAPWYFPVATSIPYFEALFREAATKITGSIPPRDLVGVLVHLAEARWGADDFRGAEADFAQAIELDPARAETWIARGRYFAERGAQEQADADYARAATLTSQELNRFLEGGWWVVGPYPPRLEQFCPPELDPDPSRPVFVIDDKGFLSDQPVPWRSVPADAMGQVTLRTLSNTADGSCYYALAHVYSPDERTATLWVGGTAACRCWVNDELQSTPVSPLVWQLPAAAKFLPLVLKKGHNRLLLKFSISGVTATFTARLGDHPLDRALQLNRFGLLRESADAFEVAHQRAQLFLCPRNFQAITLLTIGASADHARIAAELRQRFSTGWTSFSAAVVQAHSSAAIDDPESLVKTIAELPLNAGAWQWREVALLQYRGGHWQAALDALAQLGDDPGRHAWATAAMTYHQLGNVEKAHEYLKKCHASFQEDYLKNFWGAGGEYLVEFYPTYHEACQLIDGDTTEIDRQFAEFLQKRREIWNAQDPLTRDFDDAVKNAQEPAPVLLARGKRLAELKRWEEAEADFNKAVELQADSPDVRAARAFFYADWGKLDQAAADLTAAYSLFPDSRPRWFEGQGIDWLLAGHDELFAHMTGAGSLNNQYWVIRMIRMIQEGRLNEAKTASKVLERIGGFENMRAPAALAMGDSETFSQVCELLIKKLDDTGGTRWPVVESLTMAPVPPALIGTVVTAAEHNYQERKADSLASGFRGLAYYRDGKYAAAIADMEGAVAAEQGSWHRASCWPALAMAHYRAGNAEAARSWLARSQLLMDCCEKLGPANSGLIIDPRSIPPGVWLQLYVLHHEAKTLIAGQSPANGEQPADVEKLATPVSN